jgi:hypothetical protein
MGGLVKVASRVLGLLGGVAGIGVSALFMYTANANGFKVMVVEAAFALLLGLTAIVAAVLVVRRPLLGGSLLGAAAAGDVAVAAFVWIVMGVLSSTVQMLAVPPLVLGAVFAFAGARATVPGSSEADRTSAST